MDSACVLCSGKKNVDFCTPPIVDLIEFYYSLYMDFQYIIFLSDDKSGLDQTNEYSHGHDKSKRHEKLKHTKNMEK